MLHTIDPEAHGPQGGAMAQAVQTCVHCGFCLAACPTYTVLQQETDSPRGRIVLMKQVLEGAVAWEAARPALDRCLGCLACEPACPSGVAYRDLISPFRARAQEENPAAARGGLPRWLARHVLPHPGRLRLAAQLGRLARPLTPASWRPLLELLPDTLPGAFTLPAVAPAVGARRARVALLAGCAQQVFEPDINRATIDVLTRQGVEVVVPPAQGCCGALAWHTGDRAAAQAGARRNLAAFPADVDAIVTNAAGCGSAMREYETILRGTSAEAPAAAFARRVQDVSVFLARLGWRDKPVAGRVRRVAYHDACHLANAQGVTREPRELLRSLPGVELLELAEPHLCCGSAGTYNLDQPAIAGALGRRKAEAILATGADVVATGNIGCLMQLRAHLRRLGSPVRVRHTLQVLQETMPPATE